MRAVEVPYPRVPLDKAFECSSGFATKWLSVHQKAFECVPTRWQWTAQGGSWEGCLYDGIASKERLNKKGEIDRGYLCGDPGCRQELGFEHGGSAREAGGPLMCPNINSCSLHMRQVHTKVALVCIFCGSWAGYDLRNFQSHSCSQGPRKGLKPNMSLSG